MTKERQNRRTHNYQQEEYDHINIDESILNALLNINIFKKREKLFHKIFNYAQILKKNKDNKEYNKIVRKIDKIFRYYSKIMKKIISPNNSKNFINIKNVFKLFNRLELYKFKNVMLLDSNETGSKLYRDSILHSLRVSMIALLFFSTNNFKVNSKQPDDKNLKVENLFWYQNFQDYIFDIYFKDLQDNLKKPNLKNDVYKIINEELINKKYCEIRRIYFFLFYWFILHDIGKLIRYYNQEDNMNLTNNIHNKKNQKQLRKLKLNKKLIKLKLRKLKYLKKKIDNSLSHEFNSYFYLNLDKLNTNNNKKETDEKDPNKIDREAIIKTIVGEYKELKNTINGIKNIEDIKLNTLVFKIVKFELSNAVLFHDKDMNFNEELVELKRSPLFQVLRLSDNLQEWDRFIFHYNRQLNKREHYSIFNNGHFSFNIGDEKNDANDNIQENRKKPTSVKFNLNIEYNFLVPSILNEFNMELFYKSFSNNEMFKLSEESKPSLKEVIYDIFIVQEQEDGKNIDKKIKGFEYFN
ncbi:MAG: hypothetical protein ACTSU2_12540 [Promethearchaeota archaeon]